MQFRKGDVVHVRAVVADPGVNYILVQSVWATAKSPPMFFVKADDVVHVEPTALKVGDMVRNPRSGNCDSAGELVAIRGDYAMIEYPGGCACHKLADLVRVEPAPNAAAPALALRAECCGARMAIQRCWNCPDVER